jgi:hypothetical protein
MLVEGRLNWLRIESNFYFWYSECWTFGLYCCRAHYLASIASDSRRVLCCKNSANFWVSGTVICFTLLISVHKFLPVTSILQEQFWRHWNKIYLLSEVLDYNSREDGISENHTLPEGVNELLFTLSAFYATEWSWRYANAPKHALILVLLDRTFTWELG